MPLIASSMTSRLTCLSVNVKRKLRCQGTYLSPCISVNNSSNCQRGGTVTHSLFLHFLGTGSALLLTNIREWQKQRKKTSTEPAIPPVIMLPLAAIPSLIPHNMESFHGCPLEGQPSRSLPNDRFNHKAAFLVIASKTDAAR